MGIEGARGRMTARQRREVGAMLSGPLSRDRHAAHRFAEAFGVTPRWTRALRQREAKGLVSRSVGRPAYARTERERVRALVEAERERQGRTAGWRPILEALRRSEPSLSRVLVEEALFGAKKAEAARHREHLETERVSHEYLARDVAWGEDTTHLGQTADGERVEGEVIKDLSTLQTVGLSVGNAPTAADVEALLARTAKERGGFPLVWLGDQGAINRAQSVCALLEEEHVVHLLSRVHTPTDNAATEHQHQELKAESGLGKGVHVRDAAEARTRLEQAREVLDGGRLRATKGWRTARELGQELVRADALVDRRSFYAAACAAMDDAAAGLGKKRAILRARRQALFETLVRFRLATRHVGKRPRVRPGPTPCAAVRVQVEVHGARA